MTKKYLLGITIGSIILIGPITLVSCNSKTSNNYKKEDEGSTSSAGTTKVPTKTVYPTKTTNPTTITDPTKTTNPTTTTDPTKTTDPTTTTNPIDKINQKTTQETKSILEGLAISISDQELRYDESIDLYLKDFAYPNTPIDPKIIKINEIKDKKDAKIRYFFQKFDATTKELSLTAKLVLNKIEKAHNFIVKYIDFQTIKNIFKNLEYNPRWFKDLNFSPSKIDQEVQKDIIGIPSFSLPNGFSAKYYWSKNSVSAWLYKEFEYKVIIKHDSSGITSSTLLKIQYLDYHPITQLLTNRWSNTQNAEQIQKIAVSKLVAVDLCNVGYDDDAISNYVEIKNKFNINYEFQEFETPTRTTNFATMKLIAKIQKKGSTLIQNHPFEIKYPSFINAKAAITHQKAQKTITQVKPDIKDWTINSLIPISDIKTKMGIRNFAAGEQLFSLPSQFKISKYKLLKTPFPLGNAVDSIDRHKVTFEATILHKDSNLEIAKTFNIKYVDFRAALARYPKAVQTYELVDQLVSNLSKGIIKSTKTIEDVEENFKAMSTETRMSKDLFITKAGLNEHNFPKLTVDLKNNFKDEIQLNKKYEKVENAIHQSIELKVIFTHKEFGIEKNFPKTITLKYADFRPIYDNVFKDQTPSTPKLSKEQTLGINAYKDNPFGAMLWIYENRAKKHKRLRRWKEDVERLKLVDVNTNGYDLYTIVTNTRTVPYEGRNLGFEIEMKGHILHKKSQITKDKTFKITYTILDALPSEITSKRTYNDVKNDEDLKKWMLNRPFGWEEKYYGHRILGVSYDLLKFPKEYHHYFDWTMYLVQRIEKVNTPKPYILIKMILWHKNSRKETKVNGKTKSWTVSKEIKVSFKKSNPAA